LNPHGRLSLRIFISAYGFRARTELLESSRQFAVWTSLSPSSENPKLRCCPSSSTPSRLISLRAWLGLPFKVSPEFEQFCIARFPESTQVSLSPRVCHSATPRAACLLMIGHVARFTIGFLLSRSRWNGVFSRTSVRLASFDFLFFGRISSIASR